MQAISTKFIAPTNYRGPRIKADAGDGRKVIMSWPGGGQNVPDAHRTVALALLERLGWLEGNTVHQGHSPDGTGYFFVLTPAKG